MGCVEVRGGRPSSGVDLIIGIAKGSTLQGLLAKKDRHRCVSSCPAVGLALGT